MAILVIAISGGAKPAAAAYITSGNSQWTTAGTSIYYNTGNIGIGTTSPVGKLHINSLGYPDLTPTLYLNQSGASWATAAYYNNFRYLTTNSVATYGGVKTVQIGVGGVAIGYTNTPVYDSGDALYVNGNVGIGTTNPTIKLTVSNGTGDVVNVAGGQIAGLNSTPLNTDQAVPLGYLQSNYLSNSTASSTSLWSGAQNGNIWNGTAGAGNVGIGTTGPGEKLQVNGDVSIRSGNVNPYGSLRFGTNNATYVANWAGIDSDNEGVGINVSNLKFYTAYGDHTEKMRISAGGNVGIGTTAPGYKLEVAGVENIINSFGNPSAESAYRLKFYDNGGTYNDAGIGLDGGQGGEKMWFNALSGFYFNYGTAGQKITFDPSGNVGIGTTAPGALLDVERVQNGSTEIRVINSDITSLSSRASILVGSDAANSNGIFRYINAGASVSAPYVPRMAVLESNDIGGLMVAASAAVGPVILATNGADRVHILATGLVGIGTTNPTIKLTVSNGTGDVVNVAGGQVAGLNSTPINSDQAVPLGYLQSNYSSTSGSLWSGAQNGNIWNGTAGAGNVGIGTTGPVTKLVVSDGYNVAGSSEATYPGLIQISTNKGVVGNSGGLEFKTVNSGVGYGWRLTAPDLGTGETPFYIQNRANSATWTNQVTILNNGNVGIGTTAPGTKLDVNGTGTFTGLSSSGALAMNSNNITGVNKLTVTTIDPLYSINGVNYSTYAASISGGVKEEYVGKISLNRKEGQEFTASIDFAGIKKGSDLWVWRQVVDFNKDNVDIFITPYGRSAQVYYLITGDKIIFRSDRAVEISYRLVGKRFDWQKWPTLAIDQTEKGLEIK